MGWLGSLFDRLRGAPGAPASASEPLAAVVGPGPYRAPAPNPVAPAGALLDRLERFAGWEVVAILEGDGELYARYQIKSPSPDAPEHALACFAVDPLADEGWFAIAFDEARVFMRLAHPNVGRVVAMESTGRIWWHLCERPRGETLDRLLARVRYGAPPPGLDVIVAAFADFAAGLHAAHALRDDDDRPLEIRHPDLAPAALLLGLDGVGRVVDWGLSTLVRVHLPDDLDIGVSARIPERRHRVGFHYLPPELLSGRAADTRADVFTLGAMLHELTTGTSPFLADTDVATVHRLRDHTPPPLSALVPGCPPALDALVQRALAKDPKDRGSAGELADGLRAVLAARGAGEPAALIAGYVRGLEDSGTGGGA